MEILKGLFQGKGYIDGITITNLEGEILFSAKLNSKLQNRSDSYDLLGRNLLEVYESLTPKDSTIIKAMELGVPVYVENQFLKAKGQEGIVITSLSLPIKSGNRVVGAIDLSVQDTGAENGSDSGLVSLNAAEFPIDSSRKLLGRTEAPFTLNEIIAVDENMQKVKDYIQVVADCDLPVMIYGETGTGKEVFAQAIHNASARRNKPFVAQNCAAIPETLLESLLFGTARGAFTGSVDNKGLFEVADGGTLFLDEIDSMPIHLQSKLLRVLQDGYFRSLGSKDTKTADVKIVAALNTEPSAAIQKGTLRRDIYYRLSMMSVRIPPLRERKKDISPFVRFYINKHNATFHKNVRYVAKELLEKLEDYDWPGNVRELEHMIVYGMSVVEEHRSTLRLEDVADKLYEMLGAFEAGAEKKPLTCTSLKTAVEEYEKELIRQAVADAEGNLSVAAKMLDVPRQTLQRKAKQYGISKRQAEL